MGRFTQEIRGYYIKPFKDCMMNATAKVNIPNSSFVEDCWPNRNSSKTTMSYTKSFCLNPKDLVDYIKHDSTVDSSQTTNPIKLKQDIPPVIYVNKESHQGKPFVSLQKWEGVVTEIDDE